MRIQLSEHFTYKKLLRYVFPSIVMMIFASAYSVVDGLFVSNFVGKTSFAAINLIMPLIMGMSTVGACGSSYCDSHKPDCRRCGSASLFRQKE